LICCSKLGGVVPPAVAIALAGLGAVQVPQTMGGAVDFSVVDQSVAIDAAHQTATFTLTFDRAPDFSTDSNGQLTAFQYEIDAHHTNFETPLRFNDINAVIRGGEIFEGTGLPIRSRAGDAGLDSGGWGPVRARVPFQLVDDTLTFSTPLDDIDAPAGQFRYRLFTTQNGNMTSEVQGAAVPLPPGAWTGLILLGGTGLWFLRRRPDRGV
jgi:hypothetical protein